MTTETEKCIDEKMYLFAKLLNRSDMDHKKYQYDGVKWCLTNELMENPLHNVRGGLIADEMGLGKTIMMIGLMYCNFVNKTLIIVPPILVNQWFLQIWKTTGKKALIYHGNQKKDITIEDLHSTCVVISTYGALTLTKNHIKNKQLTLLHKVLWNRVIFDEAHHLKNQNTGVHIGAHILPSKIKWLVTGTPVQNTRQDLYSLCRILKIPASFYKNPSNMTVLLSTFMLKRTKIETGIHIAEIHIEQKVVAWKNDREKLVGKKIHAILAFNKIPVVKEKGKEKEESDGKEKEESEGKSKESEGKEKKLIKTSIELVKMMRAKQSCAYPKLLAKSMRDMIEEGVFENGDKDEEKELLSKEIFNYNSKLNAVIGCILEKKNNGCGKLIFCHFHQEMDAIAKILGFHGMHSVAKFDGRTSQQNRIKILNDKCEVIILQIQTGCEGLNLQDNYSEIYIISPHWNPAIEDQAIARCHRIGQKNTVYVKRFEMCSFDSENKLVTIDKYINDIQIGKRMMIHKLISR